MKTDLTIKIETALRSYNPTTLSGLLLNEKRDSIRVSEVCVSNSTVKGGIVDFMRAEEYKVETGKIGLCWLNWKASQSYCEKGLASGSRRKSCDQASCKFYTQSITYQYGFRLFTAIEIKISIEDFKSNHGHNFIGHLNYYAIPIDLYNQVKDLIPTGIGILIYDDVTFNEIKESAFNQLSDNEQLDITWNVLKATRLKRNLENNQVTKGIFSKSRKKYNR